MLPLAWHHLLKQAGYPDLVAFTGTAPVGPPSLGGGEQGDRRRRGAGPPVASPPAPARLGEKNSSTNITEDAVTP